MLKKKLKTVLFLHSGRAAEKLLKDTPESQWSGGMKLYFYHRNIGKAVAAFVHSQYWFPQLKLCAIADGAQG